MTHSRERLVEMEIRAQIDALTRDNASIDPAAIARALDAEQWKRWMQPVRETAWKMAQRGEIEVARHGKPVTEWPWRGVVRLRKPRPAAGAPTSPAADPATEPSPASGSEPDDAPAE